MQDKREVDSTQLLHNLKVGQHSHKVSLKYAGTLEEVTKLGHEKGDCHQQICRAKIAMDSLGVFEAKPIQKPRHDEV